MSRCRECGTDNTACAELDPPLLLPAGLALPTGEGCHTQARRLGLPEDPRELGSPRTGIKPGVGVGGHPRLSGEEGQVTKMPRRLWTRAGVEGSRGQPCRINQPRVKHILGAKKFQKAPKKQSWARATVYVALTWC